MGKEARYSGNCSLVASRVKQEDCLSPEVCGQPRQRAETLAFQSLFPSSYLFKTFSFFLCVTKDPLQGFVHDRASAYH